MDPVLFNQLVILALLALAAFVIFLLFWKPLTDRPWWAPADARGAVAAAIIVMAAIVIFYRMTHPSNIDDKMLDTMTTILFSTALVAIVNFFYGSSRSSSDKDDTINKIAMAEPAAPPPADPATPAPQPAPVKPAP